MGSGNTRAKAERVTDKRETKTKEDDIIKKGERKKRGQCQRDETKFFFLSLLSLSMLVLLAHEVNTSEHLSSSEEILCQQLSILHLAHQ